MIGRPDEIWTLRANAGALLGTITITSGDFPWLTGTWLPEPAFHEHAPLFAQELALMDDDSPDSVDKWESMYESLRAGVQLHYPDGSAVPEFLLHIDDGEAWFRWSDEAFAD